MHLDLLARRQDSPGVRVHVFLYNRVNSINFTASIWLAQRLLSQVQSPAIYHYQSCFTDIVTSQFFYKYKCLTNKMQHVHNQQTEPLLMVLVS